MASSEFDTIYARCVQVYHDIVAANPKIDAGHSVNHVKQVEALTRKALQQYLNDIRKNPSKIEKYIAEKFNGDLKCLDVPADVVIRVMVASLLHEVGDGKFADGSVKSKATLINEVLNFVLKDYPFDSQEMRQDIINMVDYCGASVWGDRIPPGSRIYQLIVRYADRLEATGWIGIVRTMTYSYVKRANYPLVQDHDEFPTTMEQLEQMAPPSRWDAYSSMKKPSSSGFSHYLDKIVHISGADVPIPYLSEILNEGQRIVKQFVLDFTNVFGRQFDIDYIITKLDPNLYNVEIKQLREMQHVMKAEGCKWIK